MRKYFLSVSSTVLTAFSLALLVIGACGIASADPEPEPEPGITCGDLGIVTIPGPIGPVPVPICTQTRNCLFANWVCGPIWWRPIIGEGGILVCNCAPEPVFPEPL